MYEGNMKIIGVKIDGDVLGVRFERRGATKEGEWLVKGRPLDRLLDADPIYGGVTIIVEEEEQDGERK
jgi:hypothetical protein